MDALPAFCRKPIFLAGLLVALAVAGCASRESPAAGPETTEEGPGPEGEGPGNHVGGSFGTTVDAAPFTEILLPGDSLASEPSVAVAPDGKTLYVAAPAIMGQGASIDSETRLWRSDDAGATWAYLGPVLEEYGTNDATLTVQPDGTLWVGTTWLRSSAEEGLGTHAGASLCVAVAVSKDRGASWDENGLGCGGLSPLDDRPWLASDTSSAYLLHFQPMSGSVIDTPALASSADNVAWASLPAAVPPGSVPSPLLAADGMLAFPFTSLDKLQWAQGVVRFSGLQLATSPDRGVSWSSSPITDEPIDWHWPPVALGDGTGIAAWSRSTDSGPALELRASRLANGVWEAPFSMDSNGTNIMAWASSSGPHLLVAWLHADHPPGDGFPSDAPWRVRLWLDGILAEAPSVVHKGPMDRGMGDFLSAVLLPDGRPVVALASDAEGEEFGKAPLHVIVGPPFLED